MANIDFAPSVFASGDPEPEETAKPSYWRQGIIAFVLFLILITSIAYAVSMRSAPSSRHDVTRLVSPNIPRIEPTQTNSPTPVDFNQKLDCTGDEVICTVATADKPAHFLRKLAATIPAASAKRFRIRLSITAIDEPPVDQASVDSSTP